MSISNLKLYIDQSPYNVEQDYWYFDAPVAPALSVNGIYIDWDDDVPTNTYTIEYSANSGVDWSVIVDNCATTHYAWHLSSSQYTALFGSDYINDNVHIRVSSNEDAGEATLSDVYFAKVSISNVLPDGNSATIHYHDAFNIVWDELYQSDTLMVDIVLKAMSGPVEYVLYQNVPMATFNATWNMGHYLLPPAYSSRVPAPLPSGFYKIIIRGAAGTEHLTNRYETTQFTVVNNYKDNGTLRQCNPFERLDTFRRIAGEKGRLPDEAITVAQVEAGRGIKITQRGDEGRRVGADGLEDHTLDPNPAWNKANNLVVEIDESEFNFRKPRTMQGIFSPSTLESSWQAGVDYYGTMFSYIITHNWELGNPADESYIAGQNRGSFQIEIRPITDDDPYDPSSPAQNTWVQYEPISANEIKCYCVKKGGTYQPALSKDEIDANPLSNYLFEFVLTERVP